MPAIERLATTAEIFAAARVVRDSTVLQTYGPSDEPSEWVHNRRAALALAYVQNIHYLYSSGIDFDQRFICVQGADGWYDPWRVYANNKADELLGENVDNSNMLSRYFDYESFARDLKYDYDVVELEDSDAVIVFSS